MVIIDETTINGFRLTLCEDQAGFGVHEANLHDDEDYDFRECATLDAAVVCFVERRQALRNSRNAAAQAAYDAEWRR